MTRNLFTVLHKIKEFIPDNEITFKEDIEQALTNIAYTAPEHMPLQWQHTQHIISEKFKIYKQLTDTPPWAQEIIKIWTNQI